MDTSKILMEVTHYRELVPKLQSENAALKKKVEDVRRLAEGNITGCGTCSAIREAIKGE